jgi:hypothetical protein
MSRTFEDRSLVSGSPVLRKILLTVFCVAVVDTMCS